MRCKPGDLAVIVVSPSGHNLSKIVEVCAYRGIHSEFGPIWRIRTGGSPLVTEYGCVGVTCDIPDAWLRPIRDSDGEDETLRFAGKPQETVN
jgi:hypothetical protein